MASRRRNGIALPSAGAGSLAEVAFAVRNAARPDEEFGNFATRDEFQALAGERREVGLPSYDGKSMPLFSKDRKQLIKAEVDKDVAVKLAQVAGADFILIAYSEWAVATGKFVPTSKALAKNVVSVYDASGKPVFQDRSDAQGDKTLGAMGRVVVDQNSIGEWVAAYDKGIHALYGAPRD